MMVGALEIRDKLVWRWVAVALAFPIAGLIGRAVSGPVDAPLAALVGGLLTGAGLGAIQWLAAKEAFGDGRIWIAASALGYGFGLMAGAAVVRHGGRDQQRHARRLDGCAAD